MDKLIKKKQRMQLLAVMNMNSEWINSEEDLQTIQNLAESLFNQCPPFPTVKNNWNTFKRSDYMFLLSLGYDTKDITEIYQVSTHGVNTWKKNQGFFGIRKDELLETYSDEIVKARKHKKLSDYGIHD